MASNVGQSPSTSSSSCRDDYEIAESVRLIGEFKVAVQAIHKFPSDRVLESMGRIHDLLDLYGNIDLTTELKAVPKLLQWIQVKGHPDIQVKAGELLCQLFDLRMDVDSCCTDSFWGSQILIDLLDSPIDSVIEVAVRMLSRMAISKAQLCNELINQGIMPRLVHLINSVTDESLLCLLSECLGNLFSHKSVPSNVTTMCIPAIRVLLVNGSPAVVASACCTLATAVHCMDNTHIDQLSNLEIIERLLYIVNTYDDDLALQWALESIMNIISSVAKTHTGGSEANRSTMLTRVILTARQFRFSNNDSRRMSTLQHEARLFELLEELFNWELMPALTRCLQRNNVDTQSQSVTTIDHIITHSISAYHPTVLAIRKAALRSLVALLVDPLTVKQIRIITMRLVSKIVESGRLMGLCGYLRVSVNVDELGELESYFISEEEEIRYIAREFVRWALERRLPLEVTEDGVPRQPIASDRSRCNAYCVVIVVIGFIIVLVLALLRLAA